MRVVCLLRGVADGGGEPWAIAGVRAVANHVRCVRSLGMAGALTFGYQNAAVCVLTVVPVWVMVAGHVCGVVGCALAVVNVAVVR